MECADGLPVAGGWQVLDAGDAAFILACGAAQIEAGTIARVQALERRIAAARLPGLIETVPAFHSLTVLYDPLVTSRACLLPQVRALLDEPAPQTLAPGRSWCFPVCYEGRAAPDLVEVAAALACAPDELAALHAVGRYRVYLLGFLPGFPFMGDLPGALRLPRRASPRVRVPAGSVAIANSLTAIYPWESPGGWHLIGRTPVRLFDPRRRQPSLLAPGDTVTFTAVSQEEARRLAAALADGSLAVDTFCEATREAVACPHS